MVAVQFEGDLRRGEGAGTVGVGRILVACGPVGPVGLTVPQCLVCGIIPIFRIVPVIGPFLGLAIEVEGVRHGDVPVVFDSRREHRVELVFGHPTKLPVSVGLAAVISELVAFLADLDRLFDGVVSGENR